MSFALPLVLTTYSTVHSPPCLRRFRPSFSGVWSNALVCFAGRSFGFCASAGEAAVSANATAQAHFNIFQLPWKPPLQARRRSAVVLNIQSHPEAEGKKAPSGAWSAAPAFTLCLHAPVRRLPGA